MPAIRGRCTIQSRMVPAKLGKRLYIRSPSLTAKALLYVNPPRLPDPDLMTLPHRTRRVLRKFLSEGRSSPPLASSRPRKNERKARLHPRRGYAEDHRQP